MRIFGFINIYINEKIQKAKRNNASQDLKVFMLYFLLVENQATPLRPHIKKSLKLTNFQQ